MSDLINRQMAIELIHSLYPSAPIMRWNIERWEKKYKPYIEAEKTLEMLPAAEPEIIHCKDCKYYLNSNEKCGLIDTRLHFYETDKTWVEDCFCSWAEAEKGEKDDRSYKQTGCDNALRQSIGKL